MEKTCEDVSCTRWGGHHRPRRYASLGAHDKAHAVERWWFGCAIARMALSFFDCLHGIRCSCSLCSLVPSSFFSFFWLDACFGSEVGLDRGILVCPVRYDPSDEGRRNADRSFLSLHGSRWLVSMYRSYLHASPCPRAVGCVGNLHSPSFPTCNGFEAGIVKEVA